MRAAVAIENITAIEADNRHLLERAVAAEEAARLLQEKNQSLQHRIDYCVNIHRPKIAPGKAPRAASTGNLMSSFNTAYKTSVQRTPQTPPLLQAPRTAPTTPTASGRRHPLPLKLLPQASPSQDQKSKPFSAVDIQNLTLTTPPTPTPSSKRRSSPFILSQPPLSPPDHNGLAPSSFPTVTFPANPHPYRRNRPPPIRTPHSHTRTACTGSARRGSINKQAITHRDMPISSRLNVQTISLSDARRRQKPLPPMGPMSPSTVPGRVEIGIGSDDSKSLREADSKKRKGFGVFFKWGKQTHGQIP